MQNTRPDPILLVNAVGVLAVVDEAFHFSIRFCRSFFRHISIAKSAAPYYVLIVDDTRRHTRTGGSPVRRVPVDAKV